MNRRPFLQSLATGGALVSAGCTEVLPSASDGPATSDVFESHRFDGGDLVVEFRDGVDVRRAVLFDSSANEEYETVERPGGSVRFPVVLPDRLETRVSRSLRVKAETPDGWARRRTPGHVHGYARNVEHLPDGRARFDIESQADAPLLVRFVGIYGDVPNPTVDPQRDSFDRSSFDLGPGVIGVGRNRPLTPSRTDLVVPAGETLPFETTYAPFAFPDGAVAGDCKGDERSATIAIVHAAGGSAAYTFTYRLAGDPIVLERQSAGVCTGLESGEREDM